MIGHFTFSEASKHYNSKVSLEHQLPTATQKLKTTDECVVSSLISLVTCTSKVSAILTTEESIYSIIMTAFVPKVLPLK